MKAGEIIKAARKAKRMSQGALAAEIGVSAQAVSQWENGTTRPHIFSAQRLAIALGLERDWLLADDAIEAIGGRLPKSRYVSEYKGLVPVIEINESINFVRNLNFAKAVIPTAQLLVAPTYPQRGYCFAIRAEDNTNEPFVGEGDILIVNTNVWPDDNDFVVSQVKELSLDEAVIGRFIFNGDDPFAWITDGNDEASWCVNVVGTVIEHRKLRGPGLNPELDDTGALWMKNPNQKSSSS